MLNFKKNIFVAGTLALCALTACSSDNPSSAGSTTIPNGTAENSSSSEDDPAKAFAFKTAATSTTKIDGGEISIFEKESGATSFCIGDEREFTAKIRVDETLRAMKYIEFKKAEGICDSVLTAFKESCPDDIDLGKKECDENGNVEAFCIEQDSTQTYTKRINDFTYENHEICQIIYEGTSTQIFGWQGQVKSSSSTESSSSGESSSSSETESSSSVKTTPRLIDEYGNPVTEIDTAKYKLVNYTAQFTDDPSELSFDSHVLAYNGNYAYSSDFNESAPTIKEISTDKVAEYFPLTTAVAGDKINPDNCKLYIVAVNDGGQPTGHVLSKVSEGSVEVYSVNPGGSCMITQAMLAVSFLVQDCDGLINENAEISHKAFTSEVWACEAGKYSPTKKAGAYGEWYRADLTE